jgi:hypothetical protein
MTVAATAMAATAMAATAMAAAAMAAAAMAAAAPMAAATVAATHGSTMTHRSVAHSTVAHRSTVHRSTTHRSTAAAATATPAVPPYRAAKAEPAPVCIPAPIPAGTIPTIEVKAIIPPAEEELRLLNGIEVSGGIAQLAGEAERHGLCWSNSRRPEQAA